MGCIEADFANEHMLESPRRDLYTALHAIILKSYLLYNIFRV